MLCCWDDVRYGAMCTRDDCGYIHSRNLLADAAEVTDWYALFKIHPCNMAGMPGGCKYHRGVNFEGWNIPRIEFADDPHDAEEEDHLPSFPSEEEELVPLWMSCRWTLQNKLYNERVNESVRRYLYGYSTKTGTKYVEPLTSFQ